jgi:hypothetical protein
MDPLTLGMLLFGGGKLLGGLGGRREAGESRRQNMAEDARQEAEMRRRAGGRAALMRGILNANGYGSTMTDEQIFDTLLRTPRRGSNVVPSLLSGVGSGLAGAGTSLIAGSANLEDEISPITASSTFWDLLRGIEGPNGPRSVGIQQSLAGF